VQRQEVLMQETAQTVNLYSSDEYMRKNPSLHNEDAPWKCTKIIPLIQQIFQSNSFQDEVTVLDVGGGSGTILETTSKFIQETYHKTMKKIALDLSPSSLEIQVQNNPDIHKALNEDITRTSLKDKEVDVALMIDVLEHCPQPVEVLQELKRIARYVIFKVPIEDNLFEEISTALLKRSGRQKMKAAYGHINFYKPSVLLKQIEKDCGEVISYYFINLYWEGAIRRNQKPNKQERLSNIIYQLSPELQSLLIGNSMMILAKC
jgi:SAM-dependent methyltransferase